MRSKRAYDEAFREDALRLLRRGDRGISILAKDLGVPASTLDYWYKADMARKTKKPARPPVTSSARGSDVETPEEKIARLESEVAKLEKRNAELEMDRAILKKAAVRSTGRSNTLAASDALEGSVEDGTRTGYGAASRPLATVA